MFKQSSSLNETRCLNTLIEVTEDLLFSFPLPPDIVYKYESVKKRTYQQIGLECSTHKIWQLQREAIAKQSCMREDFAV